MTSFARGVSAFAAATVVITAAGLADGLARPRHGTVAAVQARDTGFPIPTVDLAAERWRRVVVDREPGQYLGHVTTCGYWDDGQSPYIVSVRLRLEEMDRRAAPEK